MKKLERGVDYKVEGYTNKWGIVEDALGFVLLENNTYGDETCYLVVRKNIVAKDKEYTKKNGEKIMLPTITSRVYETYDGIRQCLEDEGII